MATRCKKKPCPGDYEIYSSLDNIALYIVCLINAWV